MSEKFEKISDIGSEFIYLEKITDLLDEIEITLGNKFYKTHKILFKNVISYRSSYEVARSKLFYENVCSAKNGVFYKVSNSQYVDWISLQSNGIYNKSNLVHFCIVTTEYIIDIICNEYYHDSLYKIQWLL